MSARRAERAAARGASSAERRRNLIVGAVVAVLLVVVGVGFALSSRATPPARRRPRPRPGLTDDYTVAVGDASAPTTITLRGPPVPDLRAFEGEVADDVAAAVEAGKVQVEYRIVSFLDHASSTTTPRGPPTR